MTPHLSEGEEMFLGPDHTALHHEKVVIHFTIVREASLQGHTFITFCEALICSEFQDKIRYNRKIYNKIIKIKIYKRKCSKYRYGLGRK